MSSTVVSLPFGENDDTTASPIIREIAMKNYPNFVPRNNYDILVLACGTYTGPKTQDDICAFIDDSLRSGIPGSLFSVMKSRAFAVADAAMGMPAEEVMGVKPSHGDPYVRIRPIPDSYLSIRLWPSSPLNGSFCLDFVMTCDQTPVNVPPEFELHAQSTIWQPGGGRLYSLEAVGWGRDEPIPDGCEKFLLPEGMKCILVRPGKNNVVFTVPPHPNPAPEPKNPGEDVITFS